jgi:HEPN domain-containing protein
MQHNMEPGSPFEWLNRALGDFRLAQKYEPGFYYEDLCFHCQQAVEKAIKAVLIHHKINLVKTHDIKLLLNLLPALAPVPITAREAALMTRYAVSTRYPGDYDAVSEEHWKQALKIAEKTLIWAQEQIN